MNSQEPNVNVPDWIKSQHCNGTGKKPIEIYIFIDPLCPECWSLEPIIKKLIIEYGHLFSLKHVVGAKLNALNKAKTSSYENMAQAWESTASRYGMSCDGSLWFENPISSPYNASIAIKAAELQGRKKGIRFLRKIQEMLFIEKQDISDLEVLANCAKESGLDVHEFLQDFHSQGAAKAFQRDLKITSEMDVQELPTLVFFNQNIEEEGIKISGYYPYEVYVHILKEMLDGLPAPAEPPSLEIFIRFFGLVATKEISVVYNMSTQEVEREMKKLVLKQLVTRIPAKHGTFWKMNDTSKK